MTTLQNAQVRTSIDLNDFHRFAQTCNAVAVVEHQKQVKIIAVGTTPDGRDITWLQPGVDTAKHFLGALSNAYGEKLATQVAKELGLVSRPGRSLSSGLVSRAITMAATAKLAMDGVDFLDSFKAQSSIDGPATVAAKKSDEQ